MAEVDDGTPPRTAPGGAALLIVDMINDLDFPEAGPLREKAPALAEVILDLREQADKLGVPVVYVNDNFGHWRSERSRIVEHALRPDSPARDIVRRLTPRRQDYFVIKPRFSGFYATNLPVLLPLLKATRLVLTGVAADMCILFTAADAHMREYDLWIPSDAVASEVDTHKDWALESMKKSMQAEVRSVSALSLADWMKAGP